jgi:hypothetical protein
MQPIDWPDADCLKYNTSIPCIWPFQSFWLRPCPSPPSPPPAALPLLLAFRRLLRADNRLAATGTLDLYGGSCPYLVLCLLVLCLPYSLSALSVLVSVRITEYEQNATNDTDPTYTCCRPVVPDAALGAAVAPPEASAHVSAAAHAATQAPPITTETPTISKKSVWMAPSQMPLISSGLSDAARSRNLKHPTPPWCLETGQNAPKLGPTPPWPQK